MINRTFILILISILFYFSGYSQIIWENNNAEIYNYLDRFAQKGTIQWNDVNRPLSRKTIASALLQIRNLDDSTNILSRKERKELSFYSKEYIIDDDSLQYNIGKLIWLKSKPDNRIRLFKIKTKDFTMWGDPVCGSEYEHTSNGHSQRSWNGFSFSGYASKHFAFSFYIRDVTESGTDIDVNRQFESQQGIVPSLSQPNNINYTDLRGHVSYSWKNGVISIGKDYTTFGYGENGRLVLSDKAPTFPYLRFDYSPLKWLQFHYMHAWLNSNVLDSANSYPTGNTVGSGVRYNYISKFIALHSINIAPAKGWDITLGESIVYSDKLEIGYLIPIMFFKSYDQYASRQFGLSGANGQFFAQISSRNHIKNTHIYASGLIDEIRLSTLFDRSKRRAQIGFNIGASVTDVMIKYLTLGIDYTKITPFVYKNSTPTQTFESNGYVLGDWIRSNADRLIASVKYTPLPRLKFKLLYQHIRKGDEGTVEQQYDETKPQPSFLFGLKYKLSSFTLGINYEVINSLIIQLSYYATCKTNYPNGLVNKESNLSVGLCYGLK